MTDVEIARHNTSLCVGIMSPLIGFCDESVTVHLGHPTIVGIMRPLIGFCDLVVFLPLLLLLGAE